jgi:hypothetical protein
MDTSRQIMRWSIPGWLFVFLLLTFGLIAFRVVGAIDFQNIISQTTAQNYGVAVAALLAALGIPLGFIIYQIYFFMYGNVLPFDVVNFDRGLTLLKCLPPNVLKRLNDDIGVTLPNDEMTEEFNIPILNVKLLRLEKQYRTRNGRREFETRLRVHWEIIRYYLVQIAIQVKSTDVNKEFTTLSDIYHSLGASRVSASLAYVATIAYLVIKTTIDVNPIWTKSLINTGLAITIISLIFVFIYIVLTKNRDKTLISSQLFLQHSCYSFFTGKLHGRHK